MSLEKGERPTVLSNAKEEVFINQLCNRERVLLNMVEYQECHARINSTHTQFNNALDD